tara:strand:- start:114 stop:710 length:597 start_codon:yes stop_codon:yes gene_type:complete
VTDPVQKDPYDDLEYSKTGSRVWRAKTPFFTTKKELAWDRTIPTSEVLLNDVRDSTIQFERGMNNRKAYAKRIFDIEDRIEDIRGEIDASSDPTFIVALAEERNALTMEKSILESNDEAAKQIAEQHLKTMHKYRDSVGDFFIDGPHTTETRATLGSLILAGVAAYGVYYLLVPTGPARRPYRSRFRESPISGAFRYA